MRIVAHNNLAAYWVRHPETMLALRNWEQFVRRAEWRTMQQIAEDLRGKDSQR